MFSAAVFMRPWREARKRDRLLWFFFQLDRRRARGLMSADRHRVLCRMLAERGV